ncbi:hypothetical protein FHT86_007747 [Rhizobium sp. BK313]|uniref:hypothetical protein n=1 Tax=Rhizobium sp. BK313 TaxID=2587081 RepID=UPI00105F6BA1|nr:hypothetical protein [Rhizobium sp. BK313]MBB3459415.1 hypothetical protein [Rhizobium sp. BK313]
MNDSESLEFAEPYLQMTCIDPADDTDPAVLAEFSRYYTEVHTPDVVRNNPGIRRAYRYELSVPDTNGGFGPKWLSLYEWASRHGAQVFVVRAEDPAGSWRPDYLPEPPIWMGVGRGPRQWGRLMCNKLGESGPSDGPPVAIVLEGIDPPADASKADQAAFRAFYGSESSLDAGNDLSYVRVIKYEFEELGTKPGEATDRPRYLSIYEAGAETAAAFARGAVAPKEQESAPRVWRHRQIVWRHLYRRISTCIYPSARYTARML